MNRLMAPVGWSAVVLTAALFFFSATLRAQNDGPNLFKAKCAGCHGGDGSGNTSAGKSLKLRDLGSAEVQKQTDDELTAIIANGKSPMLRSRNLSLTSAAWPKSNDLRRV